MTLYEELLAAGCKLDNHASDLYVLSTPTSEEIVKRHVAKSGGVIRWSHFTVLDAEVDCRLWIEVPFHYDPFWAARAQR